MRKNLFLFLIFIPFISCTAQTTTTSYFIADTNTSTTLFIDPDCDALLQWAVGELVTDIARITGTRPAIVTTSTPSGAGIYIGRFSDKLIKNLPMGPTDLKDRWESFSIQKKADKLILVGSDVRGAVYGVFELAERLGVSPWQWWADVVPLKKNSLVLAIPPNGIVQAPSVQYRGIFLNDEDWGLQPWAAKTFEPETGDIGPQTYEKIFQLLLRLKANTIWPAMHPSTQGFYTLEGNKEMAAKYHIVVGTSHAEPMLRNNVSEWNHEFGDFNFTTNSEKVTAYWQGRIDQVKDDTNASMITLGMRGIHDSGMEGVKSNKEGIALLDTIIAAQRQMLAKTFATPITEIPQVFIPYKEVLDLYDEGLKVPGDVTLMWTDDNYGYIRRLSSGEEQKRAGGSGVYYHLSYWGRPHDYLWLSTTQPGLIWYEMSKAFAHGAHKIWIANVGDIKPGEYAMEFFLDLAWNIDAIDRSTIGTHLTRWAAREFTMEVADEVRSVMDEFYRLALLRKPEYMGWSQTEPTTPTTLSDFSTESALRRISSYDQLINKVDSLTSFIPKERLSAWFQLVAYPVKGAAFMNHKFLYGQLAKTDGRNDKRAEYLKLSTDSYQKIESLTTFYNTTMERGKWKHMMSMAPRGLPVFDAPRADLEPVQTPVKSKPHFRGQATSASDFKAHEGNWKAIKGLGYSNEAITLFPLNAGYYDKNKPWVAYGFQVNQVGLHHLEIRCIPTHANQFDHELTLEVDGTPHEPIAINTKGRGPEWKENVLRNSALVRVPLSFATTGMHEVKIYVNQSGIVLDQLALIDPGLEEVYEIPIDH